LEDHSNYKRPRSEKVTKSHGNASDLTWWERREVEKEAVTHVGPVIIVSYFASAQETIEGERLSIKPAARLIEKSFRCLFCRLST